MHFSLETSASPATPNSVSSRVEHEIPIQSNYEKLVGLDPLGGDQADDSPYSRLEKELPDTTQEVECETTIEEPEVTKLGCRHLPEEGDSVALDGFIEELLHDFEADEGLEFDVDQGTD